MQKRHNNNRYIPLVLKDNIQMNYPLIDENFLPDAVILCNGDYPTHPIAKAILAHARFICCCDGAGMKFIDHGNIPNAIVGDGDSLPESFKTKYKDIFHPVEEQEDNDQTKATLYCMAQGYKDICYLGSTGKREDHTLGNISLLTRYRKDFNIQVTMVTDYGYFIPVEGDCTFDTFAGQQISIFNINCTNLRGNGFRWKTYAYQSLWQGTLNESTGNSVRMIGDGDYLIFRTFNAKLAIIKK